MNSIMLTGTVTDTPRRRTSTSGNAKLEFHVETLTRSLPLRFWVIAFGTLADSLSLAPGDGVIILGRLEPNLQDGRVAGFSLLANTIETIESAAPPNNPAPEQAHAEASR
jgi:single-stranded DNA-binding protein